MVRKIFIILIIFLILPAFAKSEQALDFNKRISYINLNFWRKFNDEYLIYYILEATKNNHKAKSALYKSEQFRQNIKLSFANQLPSLSVAANYLGLKVPMLDNFAVKKNGFILPFEFNYEADLLLKNRDKTKSQKKLYKAQLHDEKTIYIMLATDVATTYINILKFDKTLELQEKIVQNKEEILKRVYKRYKCGTISKTELNEAKKDLASENQELENIKKQRTLLLDNLALLCAKSAYNIDGFKRGDFDNFAQNLVIPDEISSDLVFNRPDVLAALEKLKSAKIDILIAKKDFFPTFNIRGIYAFNTFGPGNFFSWGATLATLVAGATQGIFEGGRKVANLKFQKAYYNELFENFLHSDLNAIKEVNDALYQAKYDLKILNEATERYAAQKNNFELEKSRYKNGVSDFISLLNESSQALLEGQNYIEKKTQKFLDMVSLYKSVGGAL